MESVEGRLGEMVAAGFSCISTGKTCRESGF